MKLKITAALISILFLAASCSKNLDNPNKVVVDGTWKVALFTDSGNDETSDFTGYTFTFNSTGIITAVKNATSQNGTWSTTSSKFNIDLGPKDNTNKPLG